MITDRQESTCDCPLVVCKSIQLHGVVYPLGPVEGAKQRENYAVQEFARSAGSGRRCTKRDTCGGKGWYESFPPEFVGDDVHGAAQEQQDADSLAEG